MLTLSRALLFTLLWVASAFAIETPGPSADLLANPTYSGGIGLVYSCVRNFYVATTGNDANNGSVGSPWLTIQHADSSSRQPGDCINVAAGTYTWTTPFAPAHGGNLAAPTGYVVYRCQTLNACFIVYNGNAGDQGVWEFTIPYLVVDGFDIDGGGTANFGGLAKSCFDSSLNDLGGATHHVWILNNRFGYCGLSGIGFADAEWWFAIHNEVYNNAWTSQFEGSGIGYVVPLVLGGSGSPYPAYTPTAADNAFAPYHNIVSWNKVHGNGEVTTLGTAASFTTTCNTHGNLTLDGCASTGTTSAFTASIAGTVMTVTAVSAGALAAGQVINGASAATDVLQGTVIVSQATGSAGSTGTYNLNRSQTVTSRTMVGATIAWLSFVSCGNGANANLLPFTYVNTIVGGTITLTRPASTTANGVSCTFLVPNSGHTDGNGIIMDTMCRGNLHGCYNFRTLVSYNDSQFNGGRGIHIFASSNVDTANNSTYHNGLDIVVQGLLADLSEQDGQNNNWYSNVAYAVDTINAGLTGYCFALAADVHCTQSMVAGGATGANNTYFNQVLFGSGGLALFDNEGMFFNLANNKSTSDPLYVNETSAVAGDLHLQATSPAVGYAYPASFPFLLRGNPDAGAYQTGNSSVFNIKGVQIAVPGSGGGSQFDGGVSTVSNIPIPTPLSCSQATTFLARTSGFDRVHNDGYSNLICGLVNDGVWCGAKIDALYVFATQNAAAAVLNLCSTSYTVTPNGSPNFTADQGYLGVSSSSTVWLDTGLDPHAGTTNYATNSAHVSAWSLTDRGAGTTEVVIGVQTFGSVTWIFPSFNGAIVVDVNDSSSDFTTVTNAHSTGHYLANRSDSTHVQGYKNAANVLNPSVMSAAPFASQDIAILALNNSGVIQNSAAFRIAAATIGASLSSGDVTKLCHRLNLYLNSVNPGMVALGTC